MALPAPLRRDATAALPAEPAPPHQLGPPHQPAPPHDPGGAGEPAPAPVAAAVRARAGARAKATIKRVLHRAVRVGAGPELDAAARSVEDVGRLHDRIEDLRGMAVDVVLALRQIEANRINIELLKGEVRALERRLEELGMAFAPGAGLVGAPARFAELREAVYGLERRIRTLATASADLPPAPATEGPATGGPATGGSAMGRADARPTSTLFNYVGFERRFRGDPQEIVRALEERYGDLLAGHPPVVDIGCGRGELLEALAARGVPVIGVEPDPGMVAEGRARGLTIVQADAGSFLRDAADVSLGSIISTHVVEHLELDDLIEMLELAVRKLVPGGVFVAETPNPASLIVLGNSYILDPTHVRPLHPSLLAFLCESAGFRDVRLRFFAPATAYHLPPVEAPGAPEWAGPMVEGINGALARLNEVLFGAQEYAVVATTPATSALDLAAAGGTDRP